MTTAWRALLSKELRLSRASFLIFLVGMAILYTLILTNTLDPIAKLVFSTMVFAVQIYYVPISFFHSLIRESSQMHQWLYNPRSMFSLIGTKLLASWISYLGIAVLGILCPLYVLIFLCPPDTLADIMQRVGSGEVLKLLEVVTFTKINPQVIAGVSIFQAGSTLVAHLIGNAFVISASILILWSIIRWLRPLIGGWVWFILIGIVVFYLWIEDMVFNYSLHMGTISTWNQLMWNLGFNFAYTAVYCIVLFLLSIYILDKKVDV